MKKLAFSLLAVVLFVSACKKDDDKPSEDKSFSINGSAVATPYGFLYQYEYDGKELVFSSINLSDSTTGQLSAVSIDLDTLIDGGSYTFMDRDSSAYDKNKNFYDAFVAHKVNFKDGEQSDTLGMWYEEPTSGTLTVKKSGDNYTLGYSLQFPNNVKVAGKYVGTLKAMQ